jgi:hypothetical protein
MITSRRRNISKIEALFGVFHGQVAIFGRIRRHLTPHFDGRLNNQGKVVKSSRTKAWSSAGSDGQPEAVIARRWGYDTILGIANMQRASDQENAS